MRHLPHLVYLQAFEAAARHRSFTKAAAELNCTQAAISQRVRALEQFLSRPLFERRSNGLELTPLGQAYLPGISEALDMAEAATQGLIGTRTNQTVTLSAPISFAAACVAPKLSAFQALHPDIEVRINSTIWTDPNVDLADLSVVVMDAAQISSAMVPLGSDQITLVCRTGEADGLAATDLSEWVNTSQLIHVQGKHQLWQRWATAKGIVLAPTVAAIKVDNASLALEIASRSGGLAVTYRRHCAAFITDGRLVAPVPPDEPVSLVHTLIANPQRRETATVRVFKDWLSGEFGSVTAK